MVLNNQTWYEKSKKVHNRSSKFENFVEAIGLNWKYAIFCPFLELKLPNDGSNFPEQLFVQLMYNFYIVCMLVSNYQSHLTFFQINKMCLKLDPPPRICISGADFEAKIRLESIGFSYSITLPIIKIFNLSKSVLILLAKTNRHLRSCILIYLAQLSSTQQFESLNETCDYLGVPPFSELEPKIRKRVFSDGSVSSGRSGLSRKIRNQNTTATENKAAMVEKIAAIRQ
ncbi:hypothetical protein BpHYR1_005618 [Brachionus plicatilis]|uniref:Uncharacterized protein n=1 Tax=Brachionus plicatilis TaxID=10195 RepID=A0A3M7P7V3_BRAPC|nr:hypothetical protein BpHYR1_005618 [Brachionus plicatilis]